MQQTIYYSKGVFVFHICCADKAVESRQNSSFYHFWLRLKKFLTFCFEKKVGIIILSLQQEK